MVKKYIICFIFITLFFNKNIFSYSQKDLDKIKNQSFWSISTLYLPNADLSNASLSGENLWNANLWNANLCNTDLWCVSLQQANLNHANLQYAGLEHSDLCFAKLYRAKLRSAKFKETKFQNANLEEADLENTDLEDSDFENANLTKAILKKADLSKANFTNANLSYTKLHGAKIEGAIVTGAKFRCALGLTNEQKQYLRENGAINVPIDIEYDVQNIRRNLKEYELKRLKEKELLPFYIRYLLALSRWSHQYWRKSKHICTQINDPNYPEIYSNEVEFEDIEVIKDKSTLKERFFGSLIKWHTRNCKSQSIGTQTEEIEY